MALAAATRFGRQVLLALAIGVAGLAGPGASLESARPLGDRVVIRRDTFGIPHILAETEAAGGFGFGYAQAEDHAAEMAKRFLSARGEAARQFGRSMLEDDFAARRVDNIGEARRALPSVDRTFREVMDGFAEGYNAYVRKHRQTLPPWVIEISAADVLAQSHAGAATAVSAPALANALRRKYPEETSAPSERVDAQTILEECAGEWPVDADGSNAFALSGRKTVSGAPILLGNPHLRWDQLYWEAHVKVPGRLDFYGSTLVGFPWLRAGFNDRLGYVQTNNAPDTSDIFALPLDPQRPDHYRFDGRPHRLERVAVTVEVKADDGTLVTERRSYWRSHLGPIVHRTTTTAFAYRSTALDAWRAFEGFWRLSHARSMKDYVKTMSMRLSPTSNYTYADADGNILYLWNARIPKRPGDGTDYTLDVPGDTKKFVWSKLHPLGDLPQLVNPPSGYVQNANNPPWFVSLGARLDPRRYPSYFERGELALRPQLAVNMLEARGKLSVEDVKRVKFDTRLLLAERVKDDLLAAIAAEAAPSADLAEGGRILAAWDGRSSAESRGGMLFQRFWRTYRAEVQQPFAQRWDEARPFETPRGIAQTKVALVHLAQAVRWARDTYGTADVAWGEANRYRFGDLELPGEGASGELGAFRVQQFEAVPGHAGAVGIAGWAEGDRQLAGFGDAWVLLVHFTRPIQAFSVLAYGQTTDRSSSHSRDQIRVFANRDLRPAWFTEAEIAAHLERSYRPGRE
jgi:acyl-homoserine-lactone acylase